MKKLDGFAAEETGEEWLREVYKVITMRRTSMFRLITESIRLLLFGNGGGMALVVGFMSTSAEEYPAFHWVALLTIVLFALGTLAAALTMLLVTAVAIKEAHSAESALKRFADGELDRSQMLFTVEDATFRVADFATASGVVSGCAFLLAALTAVVLLILFF